MTKFRTCATIAALVIASECAAITTPAMACTDWKAVAAFDVAIVNQARNRVVDERNPKVKAANSDWGPNWEKVDVSEIYQDAMTQLVTDRDSTLADKCGGRQ